MKHITKSRNLRSSEGVSERNFEFRSSFAVLGFEASLGHISVAIGFAWITMSFALSDQTRLVITSGKEAFYVVPAIETHCSRSSKAYEREKKIMMKKCHQEVVYISNASLTQLMTFDHTWVFLTKSQKIHNELLMYTTYLLSATSRLEYRSK